MSDARLILASASPRRRELLDQLGVQYQCEPADIDESVFPGEAPTDYVERMAKTKAQVIAQNHVGANTLVLAADTSVVIDDDILGKPRDHFDGLAMLARLSGRTHIVMTAVCLWSADEVHVDCVNTQVTFTSLDRATCDAYLATDEPWDKAGGYGIQGLGGALVSRIEGSYSNVVGLPLCETRALLARVGCVTALDPSAGNEAVL
ncbi:MAG: nucleoside triphosphate pyrophosphatase [Halioglobus sp.]